MLLYSNTINTRKAICTVAPCDLQTKSTVRLRMCSGSVPVGENLQLTNAPVILLGTTKTRSNITIIDRTVKVPVLYKYKVGIHNEYIQLYNCMIVWGIL